jgi:BirA family transcriptional regulator, biotin operon repressor / biotin---[acetyl-CoA-carboxylase] ligase
MTEDLTLWAEHLEETIEAQRLKLFDRVFVLSATSSTQDAARRLCGSRPGAVVIAGRQLDGRGRQGRVWHQTAGRGLAVTFVLPSSRFEPSRLAIASGVATAEALTKCLDGVAVGLGLRWPNDVVEREKGRKLAGVLIESAPPLALVGVGVNVQQLREDWPPQLAGQACSLAELGSRTTTIEVARVLMVELERALGLDAAALAAVWMKRDHLLGKTAAFSCGGERHRGTVEAISPLHEIVLRDNNGVLTKLAAERTTLVQDAAEGGGRSS